MSSSVLGSEVFGAKRVIDHDLNHLGACKLVTALSFSTGRYVVYIYRYIYLYMERERERTNKENMFYPQKYKNL